MAIFINGKACLNLPEQVQAITEDNEAIHKSITNDEASISANTQKVSDNTTDIEALKTKTDKMVTTNTEQQIAAQKTFTQGIKTNKVTNVNGYDDMNDDGSNLTLGNASRALKLNGSQSRPQYNGSDIALLNDTQGGQWDLLMANLGIGRWSNQTFLGLAWQTNSIIDDMLPYYTNCIRTFANVTFNLDKLNLLNDFGNNVSINYCFYGFKGNPGATLTVRNRVDTRTGAWNYFNTESFANTNLGAILVADGCTFNFTGRMLQTFANNANLVSIGEFDISNAVEIIGLFNNCISLKSIKIKHWKKSFNISSSTAFEESDLVEIISNLDAVTATQTLTMGSTNLAKLTNEEILVATGKGWVLA